MNFILYKPKKVEAYELILISFNHLEDVFFAFSIVEEGSVADFQGYSHNLDTDQFKQKGPNEILSLVPYAKDIIEDFLRYQYNIDMNPLVQEPVNHDWENQQIFTHKLSAFN